MKRRSTLMVAALAALAAFSFAPANAAGAAVCETEATVTLANPENLALVDGGSGTLAGTLVCEGTLAGAALNMSGPFSFCRHTVTGHSSQCGLNPPNQLNTEAVYDALGGTGVISHVVASLSFTFNTGVACSLTLNGHTIGVQADLDITSFTCTPGGFSSNIGQAHATAAILVNPLLTCPTGPVQLCFQQLAFAGHLELIDT